VRGDVLCVGAGQGKEEGDEMLSIFRQKEKSKCREGGFDGE